MTSETAAAPDVIANLARAYAEQFSTTAETLRRRGEALAANAPKDAPQLQAFIQSDVQPVVLQKQQEFLAVVQDQSEVPAQAAGSDTYKFILETYGWIAVCLFGAGLGSVVGGLLLSPVIELFLSNFLAMVVAYVALPYYLYKYNKSSDASVSAEERRMALFYASVAMGLLNGHNLALCYSASFGPPAFLTPLIMAVVAELVGAKLAPARPPLVGACVGAAVVVHLVLGLITGSFGLTFLLSTAIHAGVALVGLQYVLHYIKAGAADVFEQQLALVTVAIVLGAVGTYMTGMTKEQLADYQAAQAREQ